MSDNQPVRRTAADRPSGSGRSGEAATRIALDPIDTSFSFKNKAYAALKNVIVSMDVYRSRADIRLDERQLAQDFGISRTPVREAMAQLEREGLRALGAAPRRLCGAQDQGRGDRDDHRLGGAREHGGAPDHPARRATSEIASLRKMFATFEDGELRAHLDEYSEVNIEFHQAIIGMSGNSVLISLAENLFTHMRMIRRKTIVEKDRVEKSIRDHMNIIQALEARDTARAEDLVRDHALGLAEHVEKYADYLD